MLFTVFSPSFPAAGVAAEGWNDFDEEEDIDWDPDEDIPAGLPKPADPNAPVAGYVSVPAMTVAYQDPELTVPAGYFVADGTVYAQSVSNVSLMVVFLIRGTSEMATYYVPRDKVMVIPASVAATMKNTMKMSSAPTYGDYPLFSVSFRISSAPPVWQTTAAAKPEVPEEAAPEEVIPEEEVPEEIPENPSEPAADAQENPAEETPEEAPAAEPEQDTAWEAAPAGLTASLSEDGTKVVLTWQGNGAAGYRVYEKTEEGNSVIGNVTGEESFTTRDMQPGEHTFFVRPRQDGKNGHASERVTILVPVHWKVAPTELTARLSEDGTKVILTWNGNGAASEYRVYQKTEDGNTALGTASGADSFTTRELAPGEYTFFVRSRREKAYGASSDPVTILVPVHWKVAPANLSAELSEDGTKVVLNWQGNGVAVNYRVYEKTEEGSKVIGSVAGEEAFTTRDLQPGEHTFFVRPRQDNENGHSSESVTIQVPAHWKAAPTGLTAELSEDGTKVVLTWQGNGIAEEYRVYEKTEDGNKSLGTVTGEETFTTGELAPGEHTFYVRAKQDKSYGISSETVTIVVP